MRRPKYLDYVFKGNGVVARGTLDCNQNIYTLKVMKFYIERYHIDLEFKTRVRIPAASKKLRRRNRIRKKLNNHPRSVPSIDTGTWFLA